MSAASRQQPLDDLAAEALPLTVRAHRDITEVGAVAAVRQRSAGTNQPALVVSEGTEHAVAEHEREIGHTLQTTRRRGFGREMLRHIISEARARGLTRLSLETGSWDYFKPAHALYQAHGFVLCGPFEGYVEDRNSLFLTLDLSGR